MTVLLNQITIKLFLTLSRSKTFDIESYLVSEQKRHVKRYLTGCIITLFGFTRRSSFQCYVDRHSDKGTVVAWIVRKRQLSLRNAKRV
jgi:hypothetical protein